LYADHCIKSSWPGIRPGHLFSEREQMRGSSPRMTNSVFPSHQGRRNSGLLPFRQLQLDATVARFGVLGVGIVDGLELAEARGDQMLRLNAVLNEDIDH
jgi:hypothetical protein